jgi:nucleoside-diphosphate-sugar epimerase
LKLNLSGLSISDLNLIVQNEYVPWRKFENSKILIYGGTGFIGSWLTTALKYANSKLGLNIEVSIVTRDARAAQVKFGSIVSNGIQFIEHDFAFGPLNDFFQADYIFHGATPTRVLTGSINSVNLLNASINAASHAIRCKSSRFEVPMVVHLSSGAVYGRQSMENSHRSEDDKVANELDAYGQAKLATDRVLKDALCEGKIQFQSPRLFAFTGPLLQLDAHFAVGNFVLDGVQGKPISVNGNPNTLRSYMYPSDLVIAILTIATHDEFLNVNIGSEEIISMSNLAYLISRLTTQKEVLFTNPNLNPSNYVPSISRLKSILPGYKFLTLEDSLRRWIEWINRQDLPAKEA